MGVGTNCRLTAFISSRFVKACDKNIFEVIFVVNLAFGINGFVVLYQLSSSCTCSARVTRCYRFIKTQKAVQWVCLHSISENFVWISIL